MKNLKILNQVFSSANPITLSDRELQSQTIRNYGRLFNQKKNMKLLTSVLVFSGLVLSINAFAGDQNDACSPVFKACAAQGFVKDEKAPAGKKIYLNCADIILNQKKAVATVDIDPTGFDANNCRDYRKAKEKFDADWAQNHPKQ